MVLFDRILSLFSRDMGIDLGTCNTLVYLRGQGVVLSEPSVVAVNSRTNEVLNHGQAVGMYAKRMVGRTPTNIIAVRPLKDGVISDLNYAEALLRYFIGKVHNNRPWVRPRVVISYPYGITDVEKKAITIAARRAGARRVYLVPEPLAAAVGVGLQTNEPVGNMIVNIGGGTTEVAIISMSGMVNAVSMRTAGDEFDEAIVNYVKRQHNFVISETTAELIKIQIGSAFTLEKELLLDVSGRDQVKGMPLKVTLKSEEIREAIQDPVRQIVTAVKNALENVPPDLAGDIYTRGIYLSGGGALLRGLDKLLNKETRGIPVHVAEDPLRAVVRGTGWFLENLELVGEAFESFE
jgi:rod shape-determining protein MreB